jgi:sec-independent protein translocase protein TatC
MNAPPHNDPQATMTFGDHLEELRRRLILALLAPLPLAIVAFFFSEQLIGILRRPLMSVLRSEKLPETLHVFSALEMLSVRLKLSIIAALVLAAPWILWQAWLFISPGLFRHEKRFVYFLLPGSAVLTVAGASLFYFGMLPLMLLVLVKFSQSEHVAMTLRLDWYISMVMMMLLGMVVAFHLPLVILLAGWIGLVRVQWLASQRKYALLACAILAAVITPADPFSMVAMLIPLYGLFELGILLLRLAPAGAVAEGRVGPLAWSDKAGQPQSRP